MDQLAVAEHGRVALEKSCDSTDDVIALLERILATTLMLVVVLVSRNLLLEIAVLIAAVQLLECRGDRADLRLVSGGFTSRIEIRQELGKMAWAASTAWLRSSDWSISSPHSLPQW